MVKYYEKDTAVVPDDADIVARLADPAVITAFNDAVFAATGAKVVSNLVVVTATGISGSGAVVYSTGTPGGFSAGAIAGLVIMCVVCCALVLGCGIFAFCKRRAALSDPVKAATGV